MIAKKHLDEIERLSRLIDFHHGRLVSPPVGCGSVLLWENTEALIIARLTAELRPHLREVINVCRQAELSLG